MLHRIEAVCDVIRDPSVASIALLPHQFPDGDCIGSAVALYHILRAFGKQPVIYNNDVVPSNLRFVLDGVDVRPYDPEKDAALRVDLAIAVDVSSPDLFADRGRLFDAAARRIVIDHHPTNLEYGEVNYVDKTAAATGECIHEIAHHLGVPLTAPSAEAIFMAIATDTGGFQYSSTSARTFEIARRLMETGFDFESFNVKLFQSVEPANVAALRVALEHLAYRLDGVMATTHMTLADYEQRGFTSSDTDGVVEYIRAIRGIEVVVFAREITPNQFKISMRSKNCIDVSAICQEFGGGGHRRAGGCRTSLPLPHFFDSVQIKVQEQLRNSERRQSHA